MRFRLVLASAAFGVLGLPGAALAIAPKMPFSYTGREQSYRVPPGVVMLGVAVEGGHGGQDAEGGGREGGVGALLRVTPDRALYAEVGGAGVYNGGPVFGGGGAAGPPPPVIEMCDTGGPSYPCADVYASSGGGASDVRTCSMSATSCPGGVSSAATRLIVGGGGGGEAGGGNSPSQTCVGNGATGNANNFQYPPGNPSGGHPVPIITAAGLVYPADYLPDTSQSGITPAGNGTSTAGFGGSQAGCSNGSVSFSDSIAGSSAVGPLGGTGGNASSLGPMSTSCSGQSCHDAGPGGGGGGGYFGGGGGATGLDKESGNCGSCNGSGGGQPGGGGSSFVSNQMMDPGDESNLTGSGNGLVIIVPAIEIDAPAEGAVYTPGQAVNASWACGYDAQTGLGVSGCTGTVANGSAIDTTPGTHTFTVSGTASSNGNHTVSATITYRVGKRVTGTKSVKAAIAGLKFKLSVPQACVAPGGKLHVTLAVSGSGKGYKLTGLKYYLSRGKAHRAHPGSVSLRVGNLATGMQKLELVITLAPTKHHGKPKTKTLTVRFSIC